MKIFAALLSAVTLLLLSCQKERDFARENSSADATGSLLVKIITKHGIDSAVHVYSYNSSGKLVDMITTGIDQGNALFNEEKIWICTAAPLLLRWRGDGGGGLSAISLAQLFPKLRWKN